MTETLSQPGRPRALRYLLAVALITLLLLAINLGGALLLVVSPTPKAAAMCRGVDARIAAAQSVPSPKIVAIGGSGVRRGLRMAEVAEALNANTVNFGLHAGFGPSIILEQARQALKPGDIALLALEFNHYVYTAPSTTAVEAMLGCFPQQLANSSWHDRLVYLFGFTPALITESIAAPEKELEQLKQEEPNVVAEGILAVGDLPLDEQTFPPIGRKQKDRMALYRAIDVRVGPDTAGAQAIRAFVDWANAQDVTVLATWPNTIDFPAYRSAPGFQQIREFYAGMGVEIVGEPEIALLPLESFYDTQYHLNPEGIRARTSAFIPALRGSIEALDPAWSGASAAEQR